MLFFTRNATLLSQTNLSVNKFSEIGENFGGTKFQKALILLSGVYILI